MGLVVPDRPQGWSIEVTHFHGPNVVNCEVVTVNKWNPLLGAYLPPSTLEHLPDLEEVLTRFWDQYPIVLGELNADIGHSQNPLSQHVADLMMYFGTVHFLTHIRKNLIFLHMKTLLQVQKGRFLVAICDNILGTDWLRFEMVGIRDVRNYSSDHFALRARLLQRLMW